MSSSDSSVNLSRRRLIEFAGVGALMPWHQVLCESTELTPFTMQAAWFNDAESAGYLTALTHNFYEQANLNLTYLPGDPEIDSVMSLVSGEADVALTHPTSVIRAMKEHDIDMKIIGAQYQKSPLSIVSLAHHPITAISDLIGRRLAVTPFYHGFVHALLDKHGINRDWVTLVPYTHDPAILINGDCDGCVDWTTKLPYRIHLAGIDSHSLPFYDQGLASFDNVVVTHADTLASRRDDLTAWMIASRQGWQHNQSDPVAAVVNLMGTYIDDTEPVKEREIFYNLAQADLMAADHGFFSMNNAGIKQTIEALELLGYSVSRDVFDFSVIGLADLSVAMDMRTTRDR